MPTRPKPTPRPKRADPFYSSARWIETRARVLNDEPLCRSCRATAATNVDHIVDRLQTPPETWCDLANLQPLCHSCHSRKTISGRGKVGIRTTMNVVPRLYQLLVELSSEAEQIALYDKLTSDGKKCRVLSL